MFFREIKGIHAGQSAYIIGKGESLNNLTKDMIGSGIVITLNSAIEIVEKLNLPNTIYSLQKDKFVHPVKEGVTLLMHKVDEFHSAATNSKVKPNHIEFHCSEFGMANITFSAIVAIEMAKQMGCTEFYFIAFDSVTNGALNSFDDTKPYFPEAYRIQAEIMLKHAKGLDQKWITPRNKMEEKELPLILITPTGGRSNQIQLCAKWMAAQTYNGSVIWIIVDDCNPVTTNFIKPDFKPNWLIIHVRPTPLWKSGDNTQARNIQAGLNAIPNTPFSGVFIIEDDDYYSPKYLKVMTMMLKGCLLCGEMNTMYYNVQVKAGKRCHNKRHSSLFQTAFKPSVIPVLEEILTKKYQYIDIELFKRVEDKFLFEGLDLAVGIKGLKGRAGIGNGHDLDGYPERLKRESETLQELIGKDAKHYEN